MSNVIQNTYEIFTDVDGTPLEDGYIFIGEAGLDPIANPLQAYWDAALTVPADDIRTKGGYPVNSGAISRLYTASNCSVLVQNKRGTLIYPRLDMKKSGTTKVLWTGPLSVVSTPTSLDGGEKFSDWDMILLYVSTFSDIDTSTSSTMTELPQLFTGLRFEDGGLVLRVDKLSDTSFEIGAKTVAIGNIQRIVGVSL